MEKLKSVLAIDDNATQLKIFEKILSSSYDLALIKTASEALALLNTRDFDVIILDIEMPDISGFEFLHEMRKIPQYMGKPVIIVTNHTEQELLLHAENSSAFGVLIKPVDPEEMIAIIEKALAGPAVDPFKL